MIQPMKLHPLRLRAPATVITLVALAACSTAIGREPLALSPTSGGQQAISGGALKKVAANPIADAVMQQLGESAWIGDGREGAPRKVYVFTDPNCPFCNKLWADARPWVDAGKVQLRHVMVGILTPTSAGKAAALLADKDPVAALDAYERAHVVGNAKTLASGRPRPLGDAGLKPLASVPPALQARLNANADLMASYRLQATPALVWKDAKGELQMRQGAPEAGLAAIFGPR